MNNRIEELEKQATTVVEGWSDECGTTRYYEFDRRKFAELIILDCIEVCKSRVGNSDYNTGRLHCVSDIRERFGIGGMSVEDKKTLIKELLGVKND
jgi:hypothetical protein